MKLTYPQLTHLLRGLSILLHAGIGMGDGVYLLSQEEPGAVGQLLNTVGKSLDQGSHFWEAMAETGAFPDFSWGMVRIAEETGRLEEALSSLADHYEERERTRLRLKQALVYPGMVLLMMLAVIAVLLIKVLPIFDGVYASLGSRLTGAAALLLQLGQALEALLPALAVLIALVLIAAALYRKWIPFRKRMTNAFLSRFGDKGLLRGFNNARFAGALSMGLSSGLPLEEAVLLASQILRDIPGAAQRCRQCAHALEEESTLSEAMTTAAFLTAAQSRMLSLGLRSGGGEQVMAELADQLSQQANTALETAVSRVEPAMVLICSGLVGLILLAVMLPLMDILSVIG